MPQMLLERARGLLQEYLPHVKKTKRKIKNKFKGVRTCKLLWPLPGGGRNER